MPNKDIFQSVRKEYLCGSLDESNLISDPLELFKSWCETAVTEGIVEPNAFSLATCINEQPTVRYVLLKDVNKDGLVFFTNYESQKGRDLNLNPRCAGVFYWRELERQVRFEGTVKKVSDEISNDYFASRPRDAKIGVHASKQSSVIASRASLENEFKILETKYKDQLIPRPKYWGGYNIVPHAFEFWQGRPGRLHDRVKYILDSQVWMISRLSP